MSSTPLSQPLAVPAAEPSPLAAADLRPMPPAGDAAETVADHAERYQPILSALRDQPWKELLSSRDLLDNLSAQGVDQSERTLRLHLAELGQLGLVERNGRRGYRLTPAGADIARELTVNRRLGSILYRMEETMCQLGFELASGRGLVSINAYIIPRELVPQLCDELEAVFRAGLAIGDRVLFADEGEDILGRSVPTGHIGLGTMCSLTLASLFMRAGVPTHPIFGGLLRIEGGRPRHFLEMIRYDATTLSPNEVFIRANLTSVAQAARGGAGDITASFREAPASALPALRQAVRDCETAGFHGVLMVGRPGLPVLNVPVHEGRVGVILATGLNPLASLWERDRRVDSRPMVGPAPLEQCIPFHQFRSRAIPARRAS